MSCHKFSKIPDLDPRSYVTGIKHSAKRRSQFNHATLPRRLGHRALWGVPSRRRHRPAAAAAAVVVVATGTPDAGAAAPGPTTAVASSGSIAVATVAAIGAGAAHVLPLLEDHQLLQLLQHGR